MERVTKSADACLTALNIMTSTHMPKAVYIEDVIERVLQYTKFHLQNTLYPQYDPVYRVDPHGGEDEGNWPGHHTVTPDLHWNCSVLRNCCARFTLGALRVAAQDYE